MTEIRQTFCSICSSDCPMKCLIEDGRIVGVEPAGGGLCSKGAAALQYVYNKDRIKTALKRVGEKGSGKFEAVSMDEALSITAKRLLELREKYGPESVVFYAGYPKWFRPALLRFSNAFGSPNFCTESSTCFQAYALSWALTFGGKPAGPDLKNCRTLVLWSRNIFHSDIKMGPVLRDLKKRGVKIIDVDPRNTVTAREADIRLDPIPGTDGALALAMGNVIIKEGLYDKAFTEKYVYGFKEYCDYARGFTPEKAQEITGVGAAKIIEAARLYAKNSPSAIMFSASPVVHNINGVQNYRAVEALIAITGNYDIEGGNRVRAAAAAPLNEFGKVIRKKEPEAIGQREFPAWFDCSCEEAQCIHLGRQILTGEPYPLKGLFAMGMNHRMWPKPSKLNEALSRLEFYVDTDIFMSESAKYADIILPAQSFFEHDEILPQRGEAVRMRPAIIPPYGDAENDIVIIQRLMKLMGLSDDVLSGSYDEYMEYILSPSGVSLKELRNKPEGVPGKNLIKPVVKSYETKRFSTPSGKVELYSLVLEKYRESHGYEPLPHYTDFREKTARKLGSREKAEEFEKSYPLILNTGSRRPQFFHSRTYRMSWLKNLEEASLIEMHPDDADERGLRDGDRVKISSPMGSIEAFLSVNLSCHPGVVNIYHGNESSDANELIPEDYLDPVSGFPGFKSYFCEVRKINEGSN